MNFKNLSNEEQILELNKARNQACLKAKNVALVIDEINRGNSSAIFGTILSHKIIEREWQKKKFWTLINSSNFDTVFQQ